MPEDNDQQTSPSIEDPKEYIRSLEPLADKNPDEKIQGEIERAQGVLQIPQKIEQEGKEEINLGSQIGEFSNDLDERTMAVETSAEIVSETGKEGKEVLAEKIRDFQDSFAIVKESLNEKLPSEILELAKKFPEAADFGEEIKKLVEFINSVDQIDNALEKTKKALNNLPDEILPSFLALEGLTKNLKKEGQQKINKAQDIKEQNAGMFSKANEIIDNAQKNLETRQGTIGRNMSGDFAKELTKYSGPAETRKQVNKSYMNKVEERITKNMEGRSQEEIAQAVENAKARINQAIEEEQARNNQTNVSTPSSSYTTLVS